MSTRVVRRSVTRANPRRAPPSRLSTPRLFRSDFISTTLRNGPAGVISVCTEIVSQVQARGEATLGLPLGPGGTTYRALDHPTEIGAVQVRPAGEVRVVDPGRLVMLWAGHRRLSWDVVDRFEVGASAPVVERSVTNPAAVLGGFGAVVAQMGANRIADYETVLVYGDPRIEVSGRVRNPEPGMVTTVMVADPDPLLAGYGRVTPPTQAWVDLFSLPGWQAARFVHDLLSMLVPDDTTEPRVLSA